ncbi:hypothetical protein AQ490_23500 [Wenjunlia vitaminophila]|uniref:NfeD-like C-terminal domain-containing protein n=1 Tax=Wenjunlia vitaminophila TaxID=76728 RepID=A0A0T6LSU0_WENVI|nr:hypothetical protein [Wenjunlia vitaminophila]KRV48898.1 hypothetical protein AQ490_23500 [Wenjunlia vitaminophila]
MTFLLVAGIVGVVLLALSLVLDGVLEGVFDGVDAFGGLFSLPVVTAFLSMLGFVGAIVLGTTELGAGAAALVGAGAGVGTAALVWWLGRALMRDRGGAPRNEDLVGTSGSVVTAIPAGGYGEVLLHLSGQPVKLAARCAVALARGTEVWVEAVPSPTSVAVRPVER